jgi:radical SAM protein with 4Fe4S-binding SPASM domain
LAQSLQPSEENAQPLFTRVIENTLQRHIPINAIIELTYRCNLRCRHCYIPEDRRHPKDLTTEELKDVITQLSELGSLYLTLTGGEVLVRRDFYDLAWHAKRLGFVLKLFTNGTLITPAHADRIAELAPLSVDISIYGALPATHDSITGSPGSYAKTMMGIRLLRERGVRVCAKMPLMAANFAEYRKVREICTELGVQVRMDPSITPMDDGCTGPLALRISDEQLFRVFSDKDVCPKGHLPAPPSQICEAGRNTVTITPRGDVLPCLQLQLVAGNVRKEPLRTIWESSPLLTRMRELRQEDLLACSTCELATYCNRCPGLAHVEDGNYLGCSSRARQLARVRRRVAEEHANRMEGANSQ